MGFSVCFKYRPGDSVYANIYTNQDCRIADCKIECTSTPLLGKQLCPTYKFTKLTVRTIGYDNEKYYRLSDKKLYPEDVLFTLEEYLAIIEAEKLRTIECLENALNNL